MSEQQSIQDEAHYIFTHVLPCQRFNVLLILGAWLWYLILNILGTFKLDASSVVVTRPPHDIRAPLTHLQMQKSANVIARKLTRSVFPFIVLTIILLYRIDVNDLTSKLDGTRSTGTMLLLVFFNMAPLFQFAMIAWIVLKDNLVLLYFIKRLLLIEISPPPLRNTYIIISDSLTSFARPIIDFALYLTVSIDLTHFDLFVSFLPVFVRIFQCFREFKIKPNTDISLLFNAMKYGCNIPILVCTWYNRVGKNQEMGANLECFFKFLNSCYTLFWDIKMDWKLKNFITVRYPHQIKNGLIFKRPIIYQFAIVADFIIRFWWLWCLLYGGESQTILFNGEFHYLEIIRRSIWIIFKLECEYISNVTTKLSEL